MSYTPPDYQLKQNRGFSDLASAKTKLQSLKKGNAGRIPRLVEACDEVIEAVEQIREGAVEEAENHVNDLGASSSLFDWLRNEKREDYGPFESLEEELDELAAISAHNQAEGMMEPDLPESIEEMPQDWIEAEKEYVENAIGQELGSGRFAQYLGKLVKHYRAENEAAMRPGEEWM
jgi:NTP pyrophosphatase (non-canonical NTP hydrolase)